MRDADGWQPGGNIRVAFRAELVPTLPRRIVDPDTSDGDAFAASRKPLLAAFDTVAGRETLINVHLSSRGAADPAFGAVQPLSIGAAAERRAQSEVIAREVDALLAADPEARVLVLGDFNAFTFEPELTDLEAGARLFNLQRDLPEEARYTYVFESQAHALDYVLVSPAAREGATFEILNLNAGRLSAASDHDPTLVALATKPAPGPVPEPDDRAIPAPPPSLVGEQL